MPLRCVGARARGRGRAPVAARASPRTRWDGDATPDERTHTVRHAGGDHTMRAIMAQDGAHIDIADRTDIDLRVSNMTST
jgi:hypothetical protein